MKTRGIYISVLLLFVLIALVAVHGLMPQTGSGANSAQVTQTHIPPLEQLNHPPDLEISENPEIRLFVSATPSMLGFADFMRPTHYVTVSSSFIRMLNGMSDQLHVFKVDLEPPRGYTDLDLNSLLEHIGNTDFYTSFSDNMSQSVSRRIFDSFSTETLNIFITDFYDFRDGERVFSKLTQDFIGNDLAVAVMAFQSGFAGNLYDFARQSQTITIGSLPSSQWEGDVIERTEFAFRPFYIVVAGNLADVENIVTTFEATLPRIFGNVEYRNIQHRSAIFHAQYVGVAIDTNNVSIRGHDSGVTRIPNGLNSGTGSLEYFQVQRAVETSELTVALTYLQNTHLDGRTLTTRNFRANSVLRNTANGESVNLESTLNLSTETINNDIREHSLELNFNLHGLPAGEHVLEVLVELEPPAVDGLVNTLVDYNWSIGIGQLYDLIRAEGLEAVDFGRTIGLIGFTQSLVDGVDDRLSSPTRLAVFRIFLRIV